MGLYYSMSLPLIGGLVMWNIEEFLLFFIKENFRIQGYNRKLPNIVPYGSLSFTFLSQLCHFCSRLSGYTGYWRHNYARKYTLVLLLRHIGCVFIQPVLVM